LLKQCRPHLCWVRAVGLEPTVPSLQTRHVSQLHHTLKEEFPCHQGPATRWRGILRQSRQDSNLHRVVNSHLSYHWTTRLRLSHKGTTWIVKRQPASKYPTRSLSTIPCSLPSRRDTQLHRRPGCQPLGTLAARFYSLASTAG
jgi:hypothetical protein